MSQAAVDALVKLLDLEPIEVNIFRGVSPDEDRQRVFGGQMAGQALVAAARTVRDGRSFSTRRVVAIQHGKAIFNLQTSFQVPEEGLEHQSPMPDAPDPESLPEFKERMDWNPPDRNEPLPPHQRVWMRADEWLLYSQDTPSASQGPGPGRSLIHTADGRLAVTVVQEDLIRVGRS
ncbi:MAG TPA: hypothetical protein VFV32_14595 [Acidimicrobiales bacterium]|nr:hypothetical protein [Acidimicrobiales bacterium]